jgi:hypothetical protein
MHLSREKVCQAKNKKKLFCKLGTLSHTVKKQKKKNALMLAPALCCANIKAHNEKHSFRSCNRPS